MLLDRPSTAVGYEDILETEDPAIEKPIARFVNAVSPWNPTDTLDGRARLGASLATDLWPECEEEPPNAEEMPRRTHGARARRAPAGNGVRRTVAPWKCARPGRGTHLDHGGNPRSSAVTAGIPL